MTDDHKQALAVGRTQSRAVKAYLEALKNNKPKRGRKRTNESIKARLDRISEELVQADALQEVLLLQERSDLIAELETIDAVVDLSALEVAFIEAAKPYSDSKGIEYDTWRKVGVSAEVLRRAGIVR
jgi:uncharacterized protein YicC (UPF0701 family)